MAIEVRGQGSGRVRLQVLPAASAASRLAFAQAPTEQGPIVHTDGWQSYRVLASTATSDRDVRRTLS